MHTRTRRHRLLALPVALALLVTACGGDDDDTEAADPTTTTVAEDQETETTDPQPGERPEVEVELLEEGAEPRQELRLDLQEGDTSLATLEFRIEQSQELDGEPMPAAPAPPLRADVRLTVEEAGDEEYTVSYGYESFGLANPDEYPPEQVEQLDAALEGFDRITGTSVITDRGATVDGSIDVPDDVDPEIADQLDQLSQGIEQLSAPFPDEEVGVGARWRVTQEITVQELTTRQESIYTLVSLDGDSYVLDVEMTQTADPQPMDLPDAPPDASIELTQYDVSGTGRIENDLQHMVPSLSTVDTEGTIVFDAVEPGPEGEPSEFTIVQTQAITMELRREE
jgi:hypothetical protein